MLEIKGQKRTPIVPPVTPFGLLQLVSGMGHKNDDAVIEKGQTFKRWELMRDVKNTAKALAVLGVGEGDIVTVYSGRSMYANVMLFFAFNRLGAVACFHDEAVAPEVVAEYQNEFDSRVMFVYNQTPESISDMMERCECLDYIINMEINHDEETYEESILENFKLWEKDDFDEAVLGVMEVEAEWGLKLHRSSLDEIAKNAKESGRAKGLGMDREALITFTSGSTSGPKPIVFTNRNLTSFAIYSKGISGVKMWDKEMHAWMSYVHLDCPYGLAVSVMSPMLAGGTLIVTPDICTDNLNYYLGKKPDVIFAVPSLLEDIMANLDPMIRLTNLKKVPCGGERLEEERSEAFTEFMRQRGSQKIQICNGYGTGETLGFISTAMGDPNYRPDTVGKVPTGVGIMILHPETGKELGFNEPGIVCVSGGHILTRYFNRPDLEKEKILIDKDGERFLVTGDTGYVDEEGYLYLVGRATFFLNNRPSKVYYEVVRSAISQCDLVDQCYVVKGPDEKLLWAPVAFIVPKPDVEVSGGSVWHILQSLQHPFWIGSRSEILKSYEIPNRMIFLDRLPLTKANKIDFLELEKRLEKGIGFDDLGLQGDFDVVNKEEESNKYGPNVVYRKTTLVSREDGSEVPKEPYEKGITTLRKQGTEESEENLRVS